MTFGTRDWPLFKATTNFPRLLTQEPAEAKVEPDCNMSIIASLVLVPVRPWIVTDAGAANTWLGDIETVMVLVEKGVD